MQGEIPPKVQVILVRHRYVAIGNLDVVGDFVVDRIEVRRPQDELLSNLVYVS